MNGRALSLFAWILQGCGLPQCESLCARNAACTEKEIEEFDSSWQEFTGFPDRPAYEESCMAQFEGSREAGSGRGELEDTCREELKRDPC